MALFLNQNDQRTQLQSKIAADLQARNKPQGLAGDTPNETVALEEEAQIETGRSLFWTGAIAMVVIALVIFVLMVFNTK